MSKISELYLRVREADEADYGKYVIRIHRSNRPMDIQWGDRVNISLDKRNWVTCRLEQASDTGTERLYIDVKVRKLLNDNVFGMPIAQVGVPSTIYMKKAPAWKLIFGILAGVAVIAFAFLTSALGLLSC